MVRERHTRDTRRTTISSFLSNLTVMAVSNRWVQFRRGKPAKVIAIGGYCSALKLVAFSLSAGWVGTFMYISVVFFTLIYATPVRRKSFLPKT